MNGSNALEFVQLTALVTISIANGNRFCPLYLTARGRSRSGILYKKKPLFRLPFDFWRITRILGAKDVTVPPG
jgi:hypothetical protein